MIYILILCTIFYVLACLFLGLILLKPFFAQKINQWPVLAQLGSGFLLGQGILANTWLLLGLESWFKKPLIWGILILIVIIGIIKLWPYPQTIALELKKFLGSVKRLSLIWKILLSLLTISILLLALGSIVNSPAGDAEAFYMVLPKTMAYIGKLQPPANYVSFSQIGLSGEMHFAALMVIAGPIAAKFFVWFTALAAAAMFLLIGRSAGLKAKGQIVALILLFTTTAFTNYITDGKVDVFGAAFGLAAYYWVLQTRKENGWAPLVLTGLFAGFAFIAKFSNILVILPGILLILTWNIYLDHSKISNSVKKVILFWVFSLAILTGFILLSIIPHLIKNSILYGEPLAPFFFFSGQGSNWTQQVWYSAQTTKFILLTYPFALTFGQYPMQDGNLSVLIFAFAPLIFLKQNNSIIKKQVLAVALIGLAIWMLLRPSILSPRYILATLLLFGVVVASSFENLLNQPKYYFLKLIGIGMILMILLTSIAGRYRVFKPFVRLALGKIDIESLNTGPYYLALDFINKNYSSSDKIFVAGAYRYFLRPEILVSLEPPDGQSVTWEYLYNKGYNKIVIQKDSSLFVLKNLEENPPPAWLETKIIYDDFRSTVFSINKKILTYHKKN